MSPSHTISTTQRPRHSRLLLLSLLGGLGVAAILIAHGAAWWSAPLAVVVVFVLAHLAVLGLVIGVGAAMTRTSDGEGAPRGELIRLPRLYDWLVRALSGGREAAMRASWLDIADVRRGDALLDVGCGTGTLLIAAAARVGPRGTLAGVEAAPEMAARARDKVAAEGLRVDVREGSAAALPFADRSFDVVLSTLVFHHLPPDVQRDALREICRVLRPGGRVVIVDMPHGHGHEPVGRPSLLSILHHGASGRLVDIGAALRELGATEVSRHKAGVRALQATRALFAETGR